MTTLCVIGNSHISAYMLGWNRMQANYPNTRLEFFGAPGKMIDGIGISGGALVAGTAKLVRYFALTSKKSSISADYDCYVVCGLRLGLLHMGPLFGTYRSETLAPDERIPLSDACFAHALRGCVFNSTAIRTIRKLRAITAAPVVAIPDPLPTRDYNECAFLNLAEQRAEADTLAHLFDTTCSGACREFDAACLFQPESTKSSVLRTENTYSEGSMSLRSGLTAAHKDATKVAKHMNADYGALRLRELFRTLAPRVCIN